MSYRAISPELQKVAKTELHEVPSQIPADLAYIQEWLSQQSHLKARKDPQWLLSFLRSCKYSLQRTKEKLELFYTMKTIAPEFFANRDPFLPEIQEVLKRGIILVLPQTATPAGPKIMVYRCDRADPEKVSIIAFTKVMLMTLDILYMEDDSCAVAGLAGIMDLKDLPYKYLSQLTPFYIKKVITCYQTAYPTRLKGLHIVNSPSFLEVVFGLILNFLNEKLRKRVHIHNSLEDMQKQFPLSVLPKDYGGEGKSCDELAAEWKLKVESYSDWFREDSNYRADETKRTEVLNKYTDLKNNVDGSFRRLQVD